MDYRVNGKPEAVRNISEPRFEVTVRQNQGFDSTSRPLDDDYLVKSQPGSIADANFVALGSCLIDKLVQLSNSTQSSRATSQRVLVGIFKDDPHTIHALISVLTGSQPPCVAIETPFRVDSGEIEILNFYQFIKDTKPEDNYPRSQIVLDFAQFLVLPGLVTKGFDDKVKRFYGDSIKQYENKDWLPNLSRISRFPAGHLPEALRAELRMIVRMFVNERTYFAQVSAGSKTDEELGRSREDVLERRKGINDRVNVLNNKLLSPGDA